MHTEVLDRYISYFRYSAQLCEGLDAFRVSYDGKGKVLSGCQYYWENVQGEKICPMDFKIRKTLWESKSGQWENRLTVQLNDGPAALPEAQLVITLCRDGVAIEGSHDNGYTSAFCGCICWGDDPEHSTFAVSLDRPGYSLRAACGPAVSRWDDALLDRADGSLVKLGADGQLRLDYSWEKGCYTFETVGSLKIQVFPRYFEDRFQVPYRPLCKTQYPTPPAGWMTWYAVKFDACEEAVLENTRLQKELLAPYGADTVWVDWEWYHAGFKEEMNPEASFFCPDQKKYPNGLKYVAQEIERQGFTPALWIAPTHEPVETPYIRENPDAVLLDRVLWFGRYIFDITHPKFLQEYLPNAIRQVQQWGYRALKWDILPLTLDYTDRLHQYLTDPECSTYEAFRKVVQTGREILGNDFYMLSCGGANERVALSACDIFDAARIGGDIFTWEEFKSSLIAPVLRLYPYHNTALYCDPDNLVLRPEFNDLHQARTRVTMVSLLGLPATFGDDLRELPPERLELLRRGLPTLDIHPMEMRELELDRDQFVVNLVINRPFERWNVAGIINLAEEVREITVDLSADLGLEEGEYLVHEYWSDTFYGVVSGSVTVSVPACGCAVLAVRKKAEHLQLVSTSRHITQGAADLVTVSYNNGVLSGLSKVVQGDLYTVKAFDPKTACLLEKSFLPDVTGQLAWTIEA